MSSKSTLYNTEYNNNTNTNNNNNCSVIFYFRDDTGLRNCQDLPKRVFTRTVLYWMFPSQGNAKVGHHRLQRAYKGKWRDNIVSFKKQVSFFLPKHHNIPNLH